MSHTKFWLLISIFFILLFNSVTKIYSNDIKYFTKTNFENLFKHVKYDKKATYKNFKFLEVKSNYTPYFKKSIITNSKKCFNKNKKFFLEAEKKFNVSAHIILSILTVESLCGHHNPKYNIVSVYKSLVELGKNKKLQDSLFREIKRKFPDTKKDWFNKRVIRKSKWAFKQLQALKKIFLERHINVFNIKGSWAGAFGLPQFIPQSFLLFAVDGNNDGKINLDEFPDAIFSIANYLKKAGWSQKLTYKKKLKVLYSYNHSLLYCKTILKLSNIFNKQS